VALTLSAATRRSLLKTHRVVTLGIRSNLLTR
jgi:hypothetical protein